MKLLLKLLLFFGVLFSLHTELSAQIQVKGSVLDAKGLTLPGAAVTVKGGQDGVTTNNSGEYSISVKDQNVILEFSFFGFETQEKTVGTQSVIDVVMKESSLVLNDVVVVGYGSMRKSDLTGSIVSVGADALESTNAQSLTQALQGQAAGVYVSTTSAAPGGASSIRIRGTNSLLADANPLYVVDGFPVETDDINSINLNDVKSVEILKDASSTAIYGSRGANGVILIQTNSGTKSAPKFSFTTSLGFQEVYRSIDLLNASEFAGVFNEFLSTKDKPDLPYYDGSQRDRPTPETAGEGTDWLDQIMRPGFVQSYNLSVGGGSDVMTYRIGGGYYQNEGVILGGDFDRVNLNINNNIKLTDWLNLQTYVSLSRSDTNGSGDRTGFESSGGTLSNALKMSPVINVYDVEGNYNGNYLPGVQGNENPVAYANEVLDNVVVDNVVANVNLGFKPLKGLDIQAKFGANIKQQDGRAYLSQKTIEGGKVGGRATISSIEANNYVNEYIANYKREFGKHRLFFTGAFSLESYNYEYNSITGTGLAIDDLSYAGIASADIVSQPVLTKTSSSLVSALGRINYIFDDRLFLTVTNRTDGNSGFAKGNKWGNFPSVALAWSISNEKFMSNVEAVSNLKLRASWGLIGNSKIGYARSLSLLANDRYPFGDEIIGGVGPGTMGNPGLKWETTEMYNLGVDLSLFENRVTMTAEAYYKYTSNMLMPYDLPATSGFEKAYINAGELENKGVEFSINAFAIDTKDFKWTVGGNISFNRDKVMKLYGDAPLVIEIGDKQSIWIREGSPIREFQGPDVVGIFKDQAAVDAHVWTDPKSGETKLIQPDALPGDIMYMDGNKDGQIDTKDDISYGSAFPDFTYSMHNRFQYKGLSLEIFITGSEGNWIQNRSLSYLKNTNNVRSNLSTDILDRWTPENTDASIPRMGSLDNLPNVEDASYIRIQNISLSYKMPKKWALGFDSMVITAGIDNVYVWTGYSGWDPDVSSAFGGNSNVNVGQDVNSYPRPRIYRVGLNLKF